MALLTHDKSFSVAFVTHRRVSLQNLYSLECTCLSVCLSPLHTHTLLAPLRGHNSEAVVTRTGGAYCIILGTPQAPCSCPQPDPGRGPAVLALSLTGNGRVRAVTGPTRHLQHQLDLAQLYLPSASHVSPSSTVVTLFPHAYWLHMLSNDYFHCCFSVAC